MDKFITILTDMYTEGIDAVILSTETTPDEIDDYIRAAKAQKKNGDDVECFNFDDMVKCLPSDCEVISADNLHVVIW